jgi:hypothetical protein
MPLRHALIIIVLAAVATLIEPLIFSGSTPLITGLAQDDQVTLYNDVIVVSAGLLGFFIAAVAILVSLDRTRKVVQEIQRGESFELLVTNMLVTVALLFVLTLMGIVGAVVENGLYASHWFVRAYEWIGLATTGELLLTGFYFSVVMFKVAQHKPPATNTEPGGSDAEWVDGG